MPRGRQLPSETDPDGFSKQELMDAGKISPTTFDMIRKAARVRGPSHGGRNWVFSAADVQAMIFRAESGRFSERGLPAAAGWRALLAERGIRISD
jgi:hypothetical protein